MWFRRRHPPRQEPWLVCWGVPSGPLAVVAFSRDARDGHLFIEGKDTFGTPRIIYDSRAEARACQEVTADAGQ